MTEDFDPTEWITTKEAANLTGYNARYLRQLVNEGKVKAIKWSRVLFINKESAIAYANEMKRLGSTEHDPRRTRGYHSDCQSFSTSGP